MLNLAVVFEGSDWIFARGLECRVDTKDEASQDCSCPNDQDYRQRYDQLYRGKYGQNYDNNVAKNEAKYAAKDAKNEGLKEELDEYILRRRANSLSDTNLSGTFGDRDEHNVHHADTANDQGDDGDSREHDRNV